MTEAEEFAEAHGLSVEEAEYILSRRAVKAVPPGGRAALARKVLEQAQAKVGVAPVVVTPAGLEKSELLDPEAVDRFYATKTYSPSITKPSRWSTPVAIEDQSQDEEH